MVPSPYGVRWTSKLICRDLRGLAANYTNKLRGFFSNPADTFASTSHVQVETELPIDTEDFHDASFTTSTEPSTSSADDSDPTALTDVSEVSLEASSTLYGLLSNKLKELYTSRDCNLPLKERWVFQGAWLLLDMATQCCASNPSYDIVRGRPSGKSEAALLLEVLQLSVSNPLDLLTSRVSQMPTMPYTKRNDDPTRRDSAFSTTALKPPMPPSPALLWYIVLAGATDRMKTVHAAQRLLAHIWPEKDATAILEVVGNPAKRLCGGEETELRNGLGRMLYPEYDALC